jgi:hypothetical protein
MEKSLATTIDSQAIEQVVIGGDLSKLSPEQRVSYYKSVCTSLGLNPLTKPFDYITLNGKLTLYARKDAAEQLRKINNISIEKPDISFQDEWIIVTVAAYDGTGRRDSDVGVVNKNDMQKNFGNALMKAITKAKRRVTLSISGLGMLDETEIDSIPNVKVMPIDDFEIIDAPKAKGNGNGHEPEPLPFEPKMDIETAKPVTHTENNGKKVRTVNENLSDLGFEPEPEAQIILDEAGFAVNQKPVKPMPVPKFEPKMSIETAKDITTSQGKRYGDLDRKAWEAMDRNITIAMRDKALTPEQRESYQYKLDALAVLLNS